MKTGFQLNKPILLIQPYSNVDMLYGPYDSVQTALSAVPQGIRKQGLTVGVVENGKVKEYWWNTTTVTNAGLTEKTEQSLYGPYANISAAYSAIPLNTRYTGLTVGILNGENGSVLEYWWNTSDLTNAGLTKKTEEMALEISIPTGKSVVTENADGKTFSLSYILTGKSYISKGYLYINDVVAGEFTPAISKTGITETFNLPSQIGRYRCRLSVTDIFGQRVTTNEYTLNYGTVNVTFNTKAVRDTSPKSTVTLGGLLVLATVNTIDKSAYTPMAIQLGNRVLYEFSNSDTYPKALDIYLPDDLQALTNTCFSLKYKLNSAINYIYDSYKFNILAENQVSVVSDDRFEGFAENKLTIPMTVESGNPTFKFNIDLTVGQEHFTYTNASGNQNINFTISRLPNLIPSGQQSVEAPVTITAVSTADSSVRATKNIIILIKKIDSYAPYTKDTNYFVFNTNHHMLESRTLTSTILSGQEESPIVYYKNSDTVNFGSDPEQIIFDAYLNISRTGLKDSTDLDGKRAVPVLQMFTGSGTPFATITEEDVIVGDILNGLSTKLFLDGNYKHIAVVYNKKEISQITGEEERYDAIYIDGTLIANRPRTEAQFSGQYIKINPQNSAVFDLASLHVYCYGPNDVPESFGSDGKDILYRNYVSNLTAIPSETSCSKLLLINVNNLFATTFKTYNKNLRALVPIGDVSGGKVSGESRAETLLRMNTASKSLKIDGVAQQKAIATFCYYKFTSDDGQTIEKGIAEVHTQGTSTLDYPVPNFKFTFYNNDGSVSKVSKTWVSNIPEKELTAKADYMDSSHLNNTPTCTFYNNITGNVELMNSLIPETATVDSAQSYARSKLYLYQGQAYYYSDAIFGKPCIIEYTDNQPSASSLADLDGLNIDNIMFTNLGSFMLNADKSAKSLGLDIVSPNSYFTNNNIDVCFSLEGKSNIDNESDEGQVDPNAALFIYAGEVLNKVPNLSWNFSNTDWLNLTLAQLESFKTFVFDSTAFEFRSDVDPDDWTVDGDDTATRNKLLVYLYPIARMWYFVARSSDADFKAHFDEYFNRNYAFLYYINLMCFAQVDNLGKNSMFDTWDGYHWFTRPYDLDSQAGFNNQGGDQILTYEEILPTDKFTGGNHTTDINTVDGEGRDTTDETIEALNNKHFSSKSSNLWKKIWNNFSDDIIDMYAKLREHGYSSDEIIANAKNIVIDKISPNQYNIDFRRKYLGTSNHQTKGFGNRWDKFRWWITKRFDFCDTYFKYSNTMNIASDASSYKIYVDTPLYVYVTDDYTSRGRQLMLANANISSSRGVVEHIMMSTNTITEINGSQFFTTFNIDTVPALVSLKLNNLITLNLNGSKSNINIDDLYDKFNIIRTIDISKSSVSISKLPETVLNFYANGVVFGDSTNPFAERKDGQWVSKITDVSKYRLTDLQLEGFTGALVLLDFPLLETINLTNANVTYLKLENLPNLKNLNITGCTFAGDVDIVNITKETLDFSNCNFNGHGLNFLGTTSNILNLILTGVVNLNEINLDTLPNTVKLDCRNAQIKNVYITRDTTTLKTFYTPPYVERIGEQSTAQYTADMTHFKGLTELSFYRCDKLQHIKNLTYTGSAYSSAQNGMFEKCKELVDIKSSTITAKSSCTRMFAYCYKLNDISTVTIGSGVTSADFMFAYAFNLALSKIQAIINTTSSLDSLKGCCVDIRSFGNVSVNGASVVGVNLTNFFGSNRPRYVNYLFADAYETSIGIPFEQTSSYPGIPDATLTAVIGKLPSSVENAEMLLAYQNVLTYIAPDMFSNASNMKYCSYAFVSTKITNIGNSEDFFGPCQNNLLSTVSTFASCEELVLDLSTVNVFKNYSKLENVSATFMGSPKVYGDITGIFNNNRSIKYLENTFNNTAISLSGLLATSHNFPNTSVQIGGLFARNKSVDLINVEVLNNFSTIEYESASVVYTAGGSSSRHEEYGVFEGCSNLSGSFLNILGKLLNKDCSRMFKDSNIADLMDSEMTTLTVPTVTSSLKMFMGCNFSNLAKLGTILFGPTKDIRATFCKATFSSQKDISNIIFDEQNEQLDYLFAAADLGFDVSNLTLPVNVISTRYMFAYYAPFKYNSLVTSSTRTDNDIDGMFETGTIRDGISGSTLSNLADHFESGVNAVYTIGSPSTVAGELKASAFGSEEHPLTKLQYTSHMFDRSGITSVLEGLFEYCTNLADCRFMFARCRALTQIQGGLEKDKDLFTGSIYPNLRDVSGMFYNSSLNGEVGISLTKARNISRADGMFGLIYPIGRTGITFTKDLFNANNIVVRSISQFATNTSVLQWPNMSDLFGSLQIAKFSFARCGMNNARAAGLFTDGSRFMKLKNMKGLFARNGSALSTTNISGIQFMSTVVKTGNFYDTSVPNGINIDKNSVDMSDISLYEPAAY